MFKRTSSFVQAGLLILSIGAASSALGQNSSCYTVASLQGSYAVVATYGANVARAFGVRSFDGNGNVTGIFVLNGPKAGSTTGERTITTGTQKGTYTVNCNGIGVITRTFTASDGTTASQIDDFVITGAVVVGSTPLATTLEDATRTPSALVPGGIFITRTYNRLPNWLGFPPM
jgi:hypothetical protein